MNDQPQIVFRASIPSFASALKFGGDVGRITFEVPQSDVAKAVALIALQGVGLKITVEVDNGEEIGGGGGEEADKPNRSGRRSWLQRTKTEADR